MNEARNARRREQSRVRRRTETACALHEPMKEQLDVMARKLIELANMFSSPRYTDRHGDARHCRTLAVQALQLIEKANKGVKDNGQERMDGNSGAVGDGQQALADGGVEEA